MSKPDLSRSQKASRIRELLRTEGDAVGENTREFNRKRYAALSALGYDAATSDVECCGMAGSFGYNEAYTT